MFEIEESFQNNEEKKIKNNYNIPFELVIIKIEKTNG